MRVTVAGPVKVRAGQSVHLRAQLRRKMKYAYCQVYSAVGKYEMSPYVPHQKLSLLKDGAPAMLGATSMRLTQVKSVVEIQIIADESCSFCIIQDVDVKGDTLVKARIRANGTIKESIAEAFRWLVGNFRRMVRGHHESDVG